MMKQVMVRAWQLAKDGANKFGGSSKEYFASSLELAWAEVKAAEQTTEVKEVRELATKHNIPYIVAEGFFKLAESIGTTVERMQIRNWRGKRVYYRDQRRSSYQHNKGAFYYNLEGGYFVDAWYKEEAEFGRI